MENPLLTEAGLPPFKHIEVGHVKPAIDTGTEVRLQGTDDIDKALTLLDRARDTENYCARVKSDLPSHAAA
ncbi:MAG: hypothetical protein ACREVY_15270 [Gammaproteobacteria bacterium]